MPPKHPQIIPRIPSSIAIPLTPAGSLRDEIAIQIAKPLINNGGYGTNNKSQIWTCSFCAANFVRRDLWQRHQSVRHPGSSTNPSPIQVAPPWPDPGNSSEDACFQAEQAVDTGTGILGISDAWQVDHGHQQSGEVPNLQPLSFSESAGESSAWQDWFIQEPPHSEPESGIDLSWLFGGGHENPQSHEITAGIHVAAQPHDMPIEGTLFGTTGSPLSAVAAGPCYDLELPRCSFRVCRSLSTAHRTALLEMLSAELAYLDPSALTQPSLQQGVHLFCRFVSKEFPIVHSYHLIPPTIHRDILAEQFGLDSPPELLWAAITLGWTVLDKDKYHGYHAAAKKIQTILRRRIIANPLLQLSPPIWLVQTLLLCLTFARYHGCREANGFATVFHGVLIQVVKRIDAHEPGKSESTGHDEHSDGLHLWFAWIRAQSKIRIIFQTFILDIQQSLLHGGEFSLSPFNLALRIPDSDDAWFCASHDSWLPHQRFIHAKAPDFLSALKSFWNSSTINYAPSTFPRAVKWLMYGILALARDMKHRNDNSFSSKTAYTSEALGSRVSKSFRQWLRWWEEISRQPHMETVHMWRNCACMFRLGHTLFEVGAADWRILAGVDFIDGRKIVPAEYSRAKRNIKAWSTTERAGLGVTYAAALIDEQLGPAYKGEMHCEHCRWCLYIAALVCWGVGFVTRGNSTEQFHSLQHAREDCAGYLSIVTSGEENHQHTTGRSNQTLGLLHVVLNLLEQVCDTGEYLVEESVRSLTRITGSRLSTQAA